MCPRSDLLLLIVVVVTRATANVGPEGDHPRARRSTSTRNLRGVDHRGGVISRGRSRHGGVRGRGGLLAKAPNRRTERERDAGLLLNQSNEPSWLHTAALRSARHIVFCRIGHSTAKVTTTRRRCGARERLMVTPRVAQRRLSAWRRCRHLLTSFLNTTSVFRAKYHSRGSAAISGECHRKVDAGGITKSRCTICGERRIDITCLPEFFA